MAKSAYIGVEGISRKVKKMYVGIDGVARKIKKAYIGIDGVARLFYSEEMPYGYYKELSPLKNNIDGKAVASNLNYCIYAGGNCIYKDVEAYDINLTKKFASSLREARGSLVGATVGEWSIFAGGRNGTGFIVDTIDAYSSNNLATTSQRSLSAKRELITSASASDYAFFGGGSVQNNVTPGSKAVDVLDVNFTNHSVAQLNDYRQAMAAANASDTVLFAGGYAGGTLTSLIEAYDSKLTKTNNSLCTIRSGIGGASIGTYALFAGGYISPSGQRTTLIDAYDSNGVRIELNLSEARNSIGAANNKKYAIFQEAIMI